MVSPTLPTAADAIIAVQSWISTLGVRHAFKFTGTLLLYSGPRRTITAKYLGYDRNHDRAKSRIRSKKYGIIDQTEIGHRLETYDGGKGVYKYFHGIYGTVKDTSGKFIYERHANAVWAFASEALMQSARGNVETLISGADLNSISVAIELPALMKNPRITSVNGVAIDCLRKIYFSGHPDAAYLTFRKVCQGELALARKRRATARTAKKKLALQEEYKIGRAFFITERQETIAAGVPAAASAITTPGHSASVPTIVRLPPPYMLVGSHPRVSGAHLP